METYSMSRVNAANSVVDFLWFAWLIIQFWWWRPPHHAPPPDRLMLDSFPLGDIAFLATSLRLSDALRIASHPCTSLAFVEIPTMPYCHYIATDAKEDDARRQDCYWFARDCGFSLVCIMTSPFGNGETELDEFHQCHVLLSSLATLKKWEHVA